ncbi:MAG: hypothetical protein GOV15_04555, partial [Candidatus Diapherotrites archaeon]|nr:hypothetical protein [Candidatus Diapherotrites archaeon]
LILVSILSIPVTMIGGDLAGTIVFFLGMVGATLTLFLLASIVSGLYSNIAVELQKKNDFDIKKQFLNTKTRMKELFGTLLGSLFLQILIFLIVMLILLLITFSTLGNQMMDVFYNPLPESLTQGLSNDAKALLSAPKALPLIGSLAISIILTLVAWIFITPFFTLIMPRAALTKENIKTTITKGIENGKNNYPALLLVIVLFSLIGTILGLLDSILTSLASLNIYLEITATILSMGLSVYGVSLTPLLYANLYLETVEKPVKRKTKRKPTKRKAVKKKTVKRTSVKRKITKRTRRK